VTPMPFMDKDLDPDPLTLNPYRAAEWSITQVVEFIRKAKDQRDLFKFVAAGFCEIREWKRKAQEKNFHNAVVGVEYGSPLFYSTVASYNLGFRLAIEVETQLLYWLVGGKLAEFPKGWNASCN
jgi:hypothetical protein